jgi:ribosomal protein L22
MTDEKTENDEQTPDEAEKPKRRRRTRAKADEGEAKAAAKPARSRTRAKKADAEEPKADAEEAKPDAEESKPDEEKPKPARSRARAKKEEPEAKAAEEKAEEPEEPEAERKPEAEKPAKPAPARKREAPEAPLAPPVVRAQARYVRSSPRKARLVCDHIRGKSVDEARAVLRFAPRAVAQDWSKLLESAVANAEHNHELVGEDLRIKEAFADEGPTLKRYRARAMGRATRIRKRTSHLTITLTPKENA